ncbi:MAG: ribonuclease Y [Myxococcales bacterium]|nr:ribonuclease Y [Myxococcales bacterium]
MTPIYAVLAFVGGIIVSLGLMRLLGWGKSTAAQSASESEAQAIIDAANAEAEELKKSAQIEGKEIARKIKGEAEEGTRAHKEQISEQKSKLGEREKDLDRQKRKSQKIEKDLEKRERSISGREKNSESMAAKAEKALADAKVQLEAVANMSAEQARKQLQELMVGDARKAAADEVVAVQEEAEKVAATKSKEIVATAIQRYASEFVAERCVAIVPLPSDDLKGRLIGREGRNIRALEAAAGIDLIIDDTSEAISVSCFNPVRREIARLAVGKLVADGRIHPTRIEEVVASSEKEIAALCKEAGEQAVFDLGLHRVHPELIQHLGRLKLRTSFASNVLDHSVEVGFLAGLLAAELGISVKTARRAGLLHDIGKAVDHQLEGDHAEVGAQLARKHGEAPKVCDAIASHHGRPAPRTVLANLVDAANQLSSARPGARREVLASYIKRLEDLEEKAASFAGVDKVYAVQAGREVRVMVHNDKISDAESKLLARDVAKKLEQEATYAGQVRVVVIRETRASDYAQ